MKHPTYLEPAWSSRAFNIGFTVGMLISPLLCAAVIAGFFWLNGYRAVFSVAPLG